MKRIFSKFFSTFFFCDVRENFKMHKIRVLAKGIEFTLTFLSVVKIRKNEFICGYIVE